MAKHFLGLSAETVGTVHHKHAQRALRDVHQNLAIGSITGQAGLGKTFAVDTYLDPLDPDEYCKLLFPQHATPVAVARKLYQHFFGEPATTGRSHYKLSEVLEVELSGRPRLVVIDEAQNLNRPCFEFLRILYDQPHTNFGLVFVGGDGAQHTLAREPMLSSRIYRPVLFRPMSGQTLYDTIRAFHTGLAHLDDTTIEYVDETIGHGNFRHWASFTHTAVGLATEFDRQVDADVIASTFALMSGKAA